MKISKNNRYYCHRKIGLGRLDAGKRHIYVPFNSDLNCKYIQRLASVYGYSVQYEIN